jgi:hypothetical protein
MANGWSTKRVLITVRTYPVPAHRGIEVSCTAGVTSDGNWIRLFPIPYRFLAPDQRFIKYQWIDVQATRPRGDPRPESYTLRIDSIQRRETVGTAGNWRARKEIIFPLRRNSLCQIAAERQNGGPTLGIFRPGEIKRLIITPAKPPNWTPPQEALLRQQLLGFEKTPRTPLEKIPMEFRYQFQCAEPTCRGHRMMCTDWEMGESYRRWRDQYGDRWDAMFRQRYEREMIDNNETHFYVGNIHQHQDNWLIVGLFYPPKPAMGDLFDTAS